MEAPGIEYAVMLHDAKLRRGLIQAADRSSGLDKPSKLKIGLRLQLAAALRKLAARVEPAVDSLSGAAARTSVALE